jgi:hypothetical protein
LPNFSEYKDLNIISVEDINGDGIDESIWKKENKWEFLYLDSEGKEKENKVMEFPRMNTFL